MLRRSPDSGIRAPRPTWTATRRSKYDPDRMLDGGRGCRRHRMTAYRDLLYGVRDSVARITINRPKQYNAFTGDTLNEMTLAIESAGSDPAVGVIVFTGTGDKAFCAGGDVNWEKEGGLERMILEPYRLHQTLSHC